MNYFLSSICQILGRIIDENILAHTIVNGAADVLLLPSAHESFGIVTFEAWSAGLPVIVSREGGIPHFVSNSEDGLLFDPTAEDSLVVAYQAMIADQALSARLCAAGRDEVTERTRLGCDNPETGWRIRRSYP